MKKGTKIAIAIIVIVLILAACVTVSVACWAVHPVLGIVVGGICLGAAVSMFSMMC